MKIRWLNAAFCILPPLMSFSQATLPEKTAPRIALVLEGGGALGLAHIGVIRWLEEHHIPVRYVAGTSMGALVGGLYAAGNDPAELNQIVNNVNWQQILSDRLPYEDLSFRRSEDAFQIPNSLTLGVRYGLNLPSGFNSGHQLALLLDRNLLPYSDIKTFDQLPIPFRCVAVDMVSREKHVFDSGSLAQAMRASMSIPGFFTPVIDGNHMYVDGGLLDNLPVDVGRQMGADLVIAVHLQKKVVSPNDSLNSFSVLTNAISVVIAANEIQSMQRADLLISVDVSKFRSTDYTEYDKLIMKGYEAAEQNAKLLSPFRVDDATWQRYLAERNLKHIRSVPTPQFIEVKGVDPILAQRVQQNLAGISGKPINSKKLEQDLSEIVGTGRFAKLSYGLVSHDNQPGLLITATQHDFARFLVNPFVFIDGSELQNVHFGLGARVTKFGTGASNSEWRTDVIFGSAYGVSTEYFLPFRETHGWFMAPSAIANTSPFDIYSYNNQIASYRLDRVSSAFDLGYQFNRNSEIRFGYETGFLQLRRQVGNPVFSNPGDRLGDTTISYKLNLLDDPVVPRHGEYLDWHFSWFDSYLGSLNAFPSTEFNGMIHRPMRDRGTAFLRGSGGTDFGFPRAGLPSFTLGSPMRLAAFGQNELLTNQYVLIQPGYMYQLLKLSPYLGKGLYVLGEGEIARVYGVNKESGVPADAVVGLIMDTVFGPIVIGGSYGTTGHHKVFFEVGKVF
ncbi:MAG TPA: patatin-like phospholipase family protein [Terriglobales bacterium]|nr:patatin-like phospholipase family protein [Terriglobales bacterium]